MDVAAAQRTKQNVQAGRATKVRPLSYALGISTVLMLAVGIRVAFWWMQSRSGAVQPGDSQEYVQGALNLLDGTFSTGDKWLRPPLYPLFLAATFVIVGVDMTGAMFLQALVTGIGTLAFGALGYAIFERWNVAFLSMLIAALFIPLAAYGSVLFAEALFVVLITASFALILRSLAQERPTSTALLGGVLFGLATLTRAVGLFFLPLLVVGIVLDSWLRGRDTQSQLLGVGLRHGALVVLATVLTIAPWTLRNALVLDRFIPVDTNGGVSFWYGTVFNDAELAQGEARLAQIPNLADKQRAAVQMAFSDIGRDPGRYLNRVRYKIVSLWLLGSRNYAAGGIVSYSPDGHSLGLTPGELPLPLSLLGDAQYILLVLGGIWGFCFAPRAQRSTLLLLWVAFGTLMSGLTIGHPRLRLPLLAAFVPYAAWLLTQRPTWRLSNNARRWQLAAALGATLLFFALIFTQHYVRWARAQLAVWREAPSVATFERAYALNSANPLWLMAAADSAGEAGNQNRVTQLYTTAVEQEPRSLYAHAKLLEAAVQRGDEAQATAHLQALRELDRDNNDLLLWAWHELNILPSTVIEPTAPAAVGNIVGFVPVEPAANERWTMANAQLRLQPDHDCERVMLTLRGHTDGQQLFVGVGGRQTKLTLTTTPAVHDVPLEGGLCKTDRPIIVSLRTDARVVDPNRQPWPVGVAVMQVSLD